MAGKGLGEGRPESAKYEALGVSMVLGISSGSSRDLWDDEELCGEGERGDGIGEWLLSENVVAEESAPGDAVFQVKKFVNLLLGDLRGLEVEEES